MHIRNVRQFVARWLPGLIGLLAWFAASDVTPAPAADNDAASQRATFDREVAPLLASKCAECHSGASPEGGLSLTRREGLIGGGESGSAVEPGKPDDSLLWQRVIDGEMPPDEPLTDDEKRVLRDWISSGAVWGNGPIDPFRTTTGKRAGYDWWSLRALSDSPPPDVTEVAGSDWVQNPIDQFVLARLTAAKLTPSTTADRRTLIRRLYFDLLGLPPTPEQVDPFVADGRADAYEQLVDRLLASPHFGARWGRHWLDVVRFGESQGFERDKLRENSWPYRDWVINAFNSDIPYDEFVRLQVAGDVLRPGDPNAVIATGFLVAAPWDEVGMSQQSAAMKAVVRQDELEDIVGVVGQTFLGLTVNCARCHEHKFDPIRQDEYYRMVSALNGVWHGSRDVISQRDRQRGEQLDQKIAATRNRISELEAIGRSRAIRKLENVKVVPDALPQPIARWSFDSDFKDEIGSLHGEPKGGAKLQGGRLLVDGKAAFVATAPLKQTIREKTLEAWVQLPDLNQRGGGVISIQHINGGLFDAIVFGEREPRRWMPGSNGFVRTKSFGGLPETEASKGAVHVAIVYRANGTIVGYRDGKPYGSAYQSSGPATFEAGQTQILFGLRHGTAAGGNRMLNGAIDAAQLYDRALTDKEIAASAEFSAHGVTNEQIVAALTADERQQLNALRRDAERLAAERGTVRPLSVYAAAPRPATVEHVLLRGNPAAKGDAVAPGGLVALTGETADFDLPADAVDADRRRALANWLTDENNPIFARVIVNRVWHYHFGTGLVDTPNDLGFNGGRPSHPELIDWLAREFIRSGYQLKTLHRLIVTSATYRQTSLYRADAAAIDADNRLLWRKSPRRLEAEAIRDTTLTIAGVLNDTLGGPGYRDFDTFTRNTQFYEMKDKTGPEFNRRSVYRTWVRSGRNQFLDAFDCPDPSAKAPKRAVTVTPLQALALLNNSFVLRMANQLAERVQGDAGSETSKQIEVLFRLAYGRGPKAAERSVTTAFITEHGLPELCRVILNSNEFLYVD
ncbi:MAG: DUF1553 domain-containing protein [Planctomycetota bacterium]